MVLTTDKIIKYKKDIMESSINAWCKYMTASNLYKFKVVNSKNHYINSTINAAKDLKEMWNRIKNLVLGKPRYLKKKCVI